MFDVEPLILDELQRLSPLDKRESGDWEAILTRATPERRARKAAIQTALAFAVIAAVAIPALAFSATVRSLVGLGQPEPRYDHAHLRLKVALPQGYVARLWTAPSTQGGACMFTTYDSADAPSRPTKITGGGFCGRAGARAIPKTGVYWSVGTALGGSYVLSGVAGPALHVSHVTLRWHGGAQAIPTRDGYFLAAVPIVASPPFRLLPFELVATNNTGRNLATYRIPTSFLYLDFDRNHIELKLRAYRRAHGCSKRPPIWHCRSR